MVKPASQRARHANQHLHPHHIRRKTAAVAVAACFTTGVAVANPTAPTVVHGTVSMNQAGSILNITNSHNAIINWGSFSIGVNELTRFIQPSALSAVLNRVVGSDPSSILGALQSNGRVFLLNPNGIVFGSGAQINVAGLVASTLNLSNEDFLNNRMRFTDGALAGSVVNQGNITGGSVYLIGNAVANKGLITSPNGEVVLAAGNSVELVSPGTPNLRVEVVAPANEAVNLGTISAEAGRVGIYAGLIRQGGVINADSAVAEGGRIMLKSTKSTVLEAGSVTTARGTSGGEIIALSDMKDGKTAVAGTLDVSAVTSGTPGAGGFIDTSASKVTVADSAVIKTGGANGGTAGTWLIDPYNITIGTDISASTLVTALGSGNVIVATDSYGGATFYGGAYGTPGLGNITVDEAISWSSANSLTLTAQNDIIVNQQIQNTLGSGGGGINLYAGWNGTSSPATPGITTGSGNITLAAPVKTTGEVQLIAGRNILQNAGGSIEAAGLLAQSFGGSVNLAHASATNTVSTIAGAAKGQFAFKNNGDLTIGTVGGVSGISAEGLSGGLHVTVNVDVAGGALTVSSPITATGWDGGEGQAGGNALISLSATNGITVNSNVVASGGRGWGGTSFSAAPANGGFAIVNLANSGGTADNVVISDGFQVQARGGNGGNAIFSSPSAANGGEGLVTITSSGGFSVGVGANVSGVGGSGGNGIVGVAGRGGDGRVTINAYGGDITVNGSINANGGSGGYGAQGSGGRGGDGLVTLAAYGGMTITGQVWGFGGSGGQGNWDGGGRGGDATLSLSSGGPLAVTGGGNVRAYGGWGGSGSSAAGGRGGDATINLTAGGMLTLDSTAVQGAVRAEGGEGGINWWTGNGGRGGNATINMTSTGLMTLGNANTAVIAQAGAGGRADGGEGFTGGDGGNASIVATSAGGITVGGTVMAIGGSAYAGSSFGTNFRGRGGDAYVSLTNTNTLNGFVQSNSYEISARGGEGVRGGDATVFINSAGGIAVTNVNAYGAIGRSDNSAARRGGDALITLQNTSASAPLTNFGSVYAQGGNTDFCCGVTGDGGNASIVVSSAGGIDHRGFFTTYGGWGNEGGRGGNAFIQLTATGGPGLGVRLDGGEMYAQGGGGGDTSTSNGGVGGNAEIRLISTEGVLITGGSFYSVQARGGRGGSVYDGAFNGGAGGSGTVFIQNTSVSDGVAINQNVTADGGEGGAGRGLGAIGGRGGDATITVTSSSTIDIFSSGYLSAQGGSGAYASSIPAGVLTTPISDPSAQGGQGGDGSVSLTAAGGITVAGSQGINVDGGRGGAGAYYYGFSGSVSFGSTWQTYSGNGGRGGHATATLQAGNGITLTDSTYISVTAGSGGSRSTGLPEVYGNGGNASISLNNTGSGAPILLNSSNFGAVNATGGDGTVGGDATVSIVSAGGINTGGNTSVQATAGSGVYSLYSSRGGAASVQLVSTSSSLGITIDGGEVYASGGDGGANTAGQSGRGGDASVTVSSAGGILVQRFVGANAGAGGSNSGFGAGNGGNAAVTFTNTSSTAPIAIIGYPSNGYVTAQGGWGLTGGNAAISMTSAAGMVLQNANVVASGGTGYAEDASTAALGGTGSVVLTNTNSGADITAQNSFIYASGGSLSRSVGNGGIGGDAVVILSSAGGITLSNSFAGGSGGNVNGSGGAATDRGGSAGLTMLAGGNILIEGGEGSAWGGSGPAGGNAAVNIIAGGNIQLEGGEGGVIRTHALPSAASSVVMAAAGDLTINTGLVTSDGMVGLGGANILVDQSTYVWGGAGAQVDASGSLTVNNSSLVGGNGIARITTGGNVLVENNSMISGYPDVVLKVGGEIFMNTGGQISAGLPTTIYLTFPMLESGGYTVNGIPGLVFDGSTGFFAGGSGAILGTNLMVTYGGALTGELNVPTDTLIVAMSNSVKPPDAEKKKDIFEDESSLKKKKEAPVCR